MIKMFITGAVISKGFGDDPALRFSENGENKCVRFRVGSSVYDKNAEKNHRYVNMSVKAFNGMVSRIESMKLDAGKYVNLVGRYDEETWEDKTTHEKKSAPVLIVDEIELCHGGNGKQNGDSNGSGDSAPAPSGQVQTPPGNFTGFEPFGGTNPYFPES
ncbi:MAG: single-stranded DNA-binding protein [Firmicutes bacterium]|nr:single-stranded DNA-binding protein [Bacillota bacterium]